MKNPRHLKRQGRADWFELIRRLVIIPLKLRNLEGGEGMAKGPSC